jgi:hypothetical protein
MSSSQPTETSLGEHRHILVRRGSFFVYQYDFVALGGPLTYFFIGHRDCVGVTSQLSKSGKRLVCAGCKAVAGKHTTTFLLDAREMIRSGLRDDL